MWGLEEDRISIEKELQAKRDQHKAIQSQATVMSDVDIKMVDQLTPKRVERDKDTDEEGW